MADDNKYSGSSSTKKPNIPEWYRDKVALVTGATGFMGKLLVSKLLISCPEIKTIYILVRDKKGVPSKNRLSSLLQQEPFRLLRENHPERLKKLVVISGDTTSEGLGISTTDAELLKNSVSILFNMAANVRFDMPLKTAVNMNTKGTANVIAFAKQIKSLKAFIHVSTAFCHCGQPVLEEKFYPVSRSPESMIKLVDETPDDLLEAMTPKVLDDQPNTYAFSKALSEDLVRRCGLPTGLARPSIVVGSWKEPDRGWVDNMNGPTGLMIGAGKGVIRTMHCNADYNIDVIPCDMAVHAIIALAWTVGTNENSSSEAVIINLTESGENPITWRYAIEVGKKHAIANPFTGILWYPGGGPTPWKIIYMICVFLFHTIPAYVLDALIMLTGNKPFLVKVQARVTYGLNLIHYYTTKEWIFKNDRLKALRDSLSPSDKETFFMDIRQVSWDDYLLDYILATRKYCLKDDPSTLPQARRVLSYLYFCDRAVKLVFFLLCGWLIYSWLVPRQMIIGTTLDATL